MPAFGFHASHEQVHPSELLAAVKRAEDAGFDAAMSSDHFSPWSERQGQSGFAWSWLGAALQATLPAADYATWIAPLLLVHAEDAVAVIATPNVFVRSEIEGRYAIVLQEALEQIWGRAVHVEVVTETAVAA